MVDNKRLGSWHLSKQTDHFRKNARRSWGICRITLLKSKTEMYTYKSAPVSLNTDALLRI